MEDKKYNQDIERAEALLDSLAANAHACGKCHAAGRCITKLIKIIKGIKKE